MDKCKENQEKKQTNLSSDKEDAKYIRVGVDYYRIITIPDRSGFTTTTIRPWKISIIKQDHGNKFVEQIPKYDAFCLVPSHTEYKRVIGSCYNRYASLPHTPDKGDYTWSMRLMEHIFGDQIETGIKLMQLYYLSPDKLAPILVLVSQERETGKTTFVNWLHMIFGENVALIGSADLANNFNSFYASKLLIAVEETLIEKNQTIEKLKSLTTAKHITINEKFIAQYMLPFYGKFILTSNNEEKFARIDQEEVRFFVRKLNKPKHRNHNIEADLRREIPAFLYHLQQLRSIDFSVSRTGFTTKELTNRQLDAVKDQSRPWLYKELKEYITDHFTKEVNEVPAPDEFKATAVDIKEYWFRNNSRVEASYIRSIIKDEFGLTPQKMQRYTPLGCDFDNIKKTGKPYHFKKDMFINETADINETDGGVKKISF